MIWKETASFADEGESPERLATWFGLTLWAAALASVAFLVLWPVVAGIVSCGDDPLESRISQMRGTLWVNLVYWWGAAMFRPVDILGGWLVNMDTLDARVAELFHLPALAAILGALWVAMKRLTPRYRLYFPLAVLFWCLHLATNGTFWQHDTIAQTWAAACGLWLGLVAWKGIERAWAGTAIGSQAVGLLLLTVLGVLTKEIFYGWVAGVGMLLLAAGAVAWRQRRKRAVFALGILLLAATLIPLGFFSLRCIAGGVSELWMGHHQTQTAAGQSGADLSRFYTTGSGRYKAHFGLNMIRNTALATAGFFTLAPIHVLRDPDAPLALRIVPVLAIGLSILLCLGPWLVVWRSPQDWPARPCGKTVAAIVFVTFLGLSPTLPMGQITELYLLGPNVGAALLLTIGVVGWWQLLRTGPAERLSRSGEVGRAIVVVAAVTLIACGAYGVASRAYHFGVTWTYAAELNRRLLNHQRSLPSDKDRVATVFLPSACTEGAIHSQYVSPPADALNLGMTEAWLNFHDPLRRMRLVRGMPTAPLAPGDMVLDCAGLPRRQHW